MKICFFGTYVVSSGYPVNRYLIEGLRQAGAQVEECREDLWEGFLHAAVGQLGIGRLLKMGVRTLSRYLRLSWRYWQAEKHQWVIVGYPGYLDVALARLLTLGRSRRVALVAFISLYDTLVVDRQQVKDGTWKARLLKWIDRFALARAELVLVDTQAQGQHYAQLFGLPAAKFHRSFVGHEFVGLEEVRPGTAKEATERFRVLFFGTYVPLHGVEAILEAAALLREEPDLEFVLIGRGQLYEAVRTAADRCGLENVRFIDTWLDAKALAEQIRQADVCLGIFGTTAKAARVIPYKIFGALALGKPVITRDSPAIRELLVDGESVLLCRAGDGRSLAEAILALRDRSGLAARIAAGGRAAYQTQAAPEIVGRELLAALERVHGH